MKMIADINKTKQCTFCKYWSDFSCRYIKPKTLDARIWEYESSVVCICTNGRGERRAISTCNKFECKLR